MLTSADKLYGDADFLFQQDFSTRPHCQNHFQVVCWPWYYCALLARQHAWPEPHLDSMGYFQEEDEKQLIQQSRRAEGCTPGCCVRKQCLKCFTLHVMNLKYIKVSLFQIIYKKIWTFSPIFWDAPVYIMYIMYFLILFSYLYSHKHIKTHHDFNILILVLGLRWHMVLWPQGR